MESRYSNFDRELLAAQAAITHFLAPISPRQQRHQAFISEFNVQLLYLPGLKNVVAYFLSRPNQTATGSVAAMSAADSVDFEEMAHQAALLPVNAAVARQHITQVGFPPDRRSMPGWKCFHRHFSPH
jgi:hypothetical protein